MIAYCMRQCKIVIAGRRNITIFDQSEMQMTIECSLQQKIKLNEKLFIDQ